MIEASFDRLSRAAAISGAYQYDTGQRLRLSGLPSPEEMSGMDDLLSGNLVTVQVHYSYEGDGQTEIVLAQWDEWCAAWLADIPDAYLTRHEPVRVYVYVYYGEIAPSVMMLGETEPQTRGCTMYEGVFTPRSRPAPGGTVTDEQLEAWAAYVEEIDLALASAQSAKSNAQTQAQAALAAAEEAGTAAKEAGEAAKQAENEAGKLRTAGSRLGEATHRAYTIGASESASVTMQDGFVDFHIPKGAQGEAGEDGPSDIDIAFVDGALTITPKEG